MSVYKTSLELDVDVDYDYQPYEKQVLYPNDKAYPGCPAEVTINAVWVGLKNVREDLYIGTTERLADEIMEYENQPPEER